MTDVVYLTKDRFEELQHDVNLMKTEGRKSVANKIAEARSYGDLSENAEYTAALEEQSLFEDRLYRLEGIINRARIIDASELPLDKVYILSTVKVKNLKSKKLIKYVLVSPEEANIEERKLSVSSPIGKALLGSKVGDIVHANVPAGEISLEVLEIGH